MTDECSVCFDKVYKKDFKRYNRCFECHNSLVCDKCYDTIVNDILNDELNDDINKWYKRILKINEFKYTYKCVVCRTDNQKDLKKNELKIALRLYADKVNELKKYKNLFEIMCDYISSFLSRIKRGTFYSKFVHKIADVLKNQVNKSILWNLEIPSYIINIYEKNDKDINKTFAVYHYQMKTAEIEKQIRSQTNINVGFIDND